MKKTLTEFDRKVAWKMIMDIAEEAGFIRFAYAGVALLNMNEEEKDETIKRRG